MASEAITRNDLTAILNEVLPSAPLEYMKTLYDGAKVSSGSLALSEPYTDFDFLVVSYQCNADEFCKIFDCADIAKYPSSHYYNGDITVMNGNTTYSSTCQFSITDSTHLSLSYYTNNANFVAGIKRVVGMKFNVNTPQRQSVDAIVEEGTSGIWTYRKWDSGIAECWGESIVESNTYAANGGYKQVAETLPTGLFNTTPPTVLASGRIDTVVRTMIGYTSADNATQVQTYLVNMHTSAVTQTGKVSWHIKGTWK